MPIDITTQESLRKIAEEIEESNTAVSNILYTVVGCMYFPEYLDKLGNLCKEHCKVCKEEVTVRLIDLQNRTVH